LANPPASHRLAENNTIKIWFMASMLIKNAINLKRGVRYSAIQALSGHLEFFSFSKTFG
jgi:hypothetical protein